MKYCAGIVTALLGVHVASIAARSPDQSIAPICFKKNGVLLPMRDSCSGFFICVNGNAITGSCGDYYHFNAQKSFCDVPERAGCQAYPALSGGQASNHIGPQYEATPPAGHPIAAESESEPEDVVYLPIMPMLPVVPPILEAPPPASHSELPKPQHPDEVVADLAAGAICQRRPTGTFLPKANSCHHYYVCIMQRPYRRTCPPQMHFNSRLQICQHRQLAQCRPIQPSTPHAPAAPVKPPARPVPPTKMTATAPAVPLVVLGKPQVPHQLHRPAKQSICANSDQRLMPHPADCGKFISCNHGRANEMHCPAGLQFSEKQRRCEWPFIAQCQIPDLRAQDEHTY